MSQKSTDQVCEHLLDILQKDGLRTENRLGALVILNKLFQGQYGDRAKSQCLKSELISFLVSALDTGLMFCHKPLELMLASVAMETMFHLSKCQVCLIQDLSQNSVLKRVLAFLDIQEKFYKFPTSLKTALIDLCEGKQTVGKVKVVSMSTEPLEYIQQHTEDSLKRLPRLPEKIKVCHLFDTSAPDCDLDITEHLVREGLVLTGEFPGHVISSDDSWQHVIVTKVLDGGMFWAVVGESNINTLFEINESLNGDLSLQPAQHILSDSLVVVKGDICGRDCYVRAQILCVDDSMVHVFAVDYGNEITTSSSQVYLVPRGLDVEKIPPLSSLCSVADISPPPLDKDMVQNAAAILSNLSKQNNWTAISLSESEGIPSILHLLKACQKSSLVTHILTLVCNLACSSKVRIELVTSGAISTVLDVMRFHLSSQLSWQQSVEDTHLVLARCLLCLCSLMFNNLDGRSDFYEHQGVDLILQLIKQVGVNHHLYQIGLKVLRTFIGSALVRDADLTSHLPQSSLSSLIKDKSTETCTRPPLSDKGKRKDEESYVPPSDMVGIAAVEHTMSDVKKEFGDLQISHNQSRNPVNCASESEDEHQEPLSSLLNQGITTTRGQQQYVYDQLVRFADDDTHELMPHNHIATIPEPMIAQHICAMLNSGHGGTVYFGIEKDRQVFGLKISRDEKDSMRLGIDRLMFVKITPGLLHSQFEFRAVPVHDAVSSEPLTDMFVIELTVRANKGTIYTMTDGACYYRFGSDTERISCLDLRKLVCLEEEYVYSEQILRLQMQKSQLLQELDEP